VEEGEGWGRERVKEGKCGEGKGEEGKSRGREVREGLCSSKNSSLTLRQMDAPGQL